MKNILIIIFFIICAKSFAIGAKGPLDQHKDALKNEKPIVLEKVGIDEHLGDKIDLTLPFVNETGEEVKLGKYFTDKPVFLMLIYYECPTLCSLHLNAMMETFKSLEWSVGNQFEFIAVSIDPDENHILAEKKKQSYLDLYGRPETKDGWHFLTGSEKSIKALASQIGFRYAWDPKQEQWAHSAAAYILDTDGLISFYHYGIQIDPKVLRLSLVDASNHKIGTIVDRMVLFCMQYDPNKKTYAFYAFNLMRLGALLTAIFLVIYLFLFWRKENNKGKKS